MHLCHPQQCQLSTWPHNQTDNQLEQRLFIQTEYLIRIQDVSINYESNQSKSFFLTSSLHVVLLWLIFTDALQLSIPAQGLANGDAALPHAAYPGIQPYPGVGEWFAILLLPSSQISIIHSMLCVNVYIGSQNKSCSMFSVLAFYITWHFILLKVLLLHTLSMPKNKLYIFNVYFNENFSYYISFYSFLKINFLNVS